MGFRVLTQKMVSRGLSFLYASHTEMGFRRLPQRK
eukprot:UN03220